MYTVAVPAREYWDEAREEFVYVDGCTFEIEHSLSSLAKWESRWHKPFLDTEKTPAETLDYIRCMTLTEGVPDSAYAWLPAEAVAGVDAYIRDPMTATWFSEDMDGQGRREVLTAEVIYYMMIQCQIPFECEAWHLNRLLTLIRVCGVKNREAMGRQKKMGKADIMRRNAALNRKRRAAQHTKG